MPALLRPIRLGLGEPIRCRPSMARGWTTFTVSCARWKANSPSVEAENAPQVDLDLSEEEAETEADETAHYPTVKKPLQIAVIGRPNAGKSTLINKILGEDRLLTGPEAGITRDAISVRAEWQGTPIRIFRYRRHAQEGPDHRQAGKAVRRGRHPRRALCRGRGGAAGCGNPRSRCRTCGSRTYAETEGRAVVVAVNKWDLEDDKQEKLAELKEMFDRLLPQLRGAPLVTVSAKTGGALTGCMTRSARRMRSGTAASRLRG